MNDHKEKSKQQTPQSTIDFIIPMQLEEVIHLANRPPNLLRSLDVHIPQRLDADHAELVATFYEIRRGRRSQQVALYATGILYRWQGTSTRFRGTFTSRDGLPSLGYSILAIALTLLLLVLSSLFLGMLVVGGWNIYSIVFCGCGAYYIILIPPFSLERHIRLMYLRRYISRALQQYFTTPSE
jgi:hypothetical protein